MDLQEEVTIIAEEIDQLVERASDATVSLSMWISYVFIRLNFTDHDL